MLNVKPFLKVQPFKTHYLHSRGHYEWQMRNGRDVPVLSCSQTPGTARDFAEFGNKTSTWQGSGDGENIKWQISKGTSRFQRQHCQHSEGDGDLEIHSLDVQVVDAVVQAEEDEHTDSADG